MSKREFTAGDFNSMAGVYTARHIAEIANAMLPEILAPYINDLIAAREALKGSCLCWDGIVARETCEACETLAAQKVPFEK